MLFATSRYQLTLIFFALATTVEGFLVRHPSSFQPTILKASNNEKSESNGDSSDAKADPQKKNKNIKSSDRAHIERNLEDMMQNDWREFRAKLIQQENTPGGVPLAPDPVAEVEEVKDPSLAKQGQLGEMFAGAISSIFEPNKKKKQQQQQRKQEKQRKEQQPANIFDGDTVGTPDTTTTTTTSGDILESHEDPFVSAAEIPLLLRETKIDRHRWAHAIPHVETGCVLLANEKLGGVFHQTVVLIVQHCEKSGSIGIVINR